MSMKFKEKWQELKRCPDCGSDKIKMTVYKNGDKYLECENCWQVITKIREEKK